MRGDTLAAGAPFGVADPLAVPDPGPGFELEDDAADDDDEGATVAVGLWAVTVCADKLLNNPGGNCRLVDRVCPDWPGMVCCHCAL